MENKNYIASLINKLEVWKNLNDILDDLHSDGFFGTEGQNDPRGDFRESMEECSECCGEGCDDCEEGYVDRSDDMRVVNKENINYVVERILELEVEDQLIIIEMLKGN